MGEQVVPGKWRFDAFKGDRLSQVILDSRVEAALMVAGSFGEVVVLLQHHRIITIIP